ncbi:A disintegrin and metalloproteinase with thrombospondin motifs adt-1-like isoform X4 [Montipora capricornis]|uniref:A disintegrin and metalloproteinase with thrombospondin motifs adt-1-like isoform X4 n=1 Tax=Montipora capricornis TaxID=246305 RepID=UPI0035F10777
MWKVLVTPFRTKHRNELMSFKNVKLSVSAATTFNSISDGSKVQFVVRAFTKSGLHSDLSSNGVIIDTSAPVAGKAYDGKQSGVDMKYAKWTNTFSANWDRFTDPHSPIARYHWAVKRQGAGHITTFKTTALNRSPTATNLNLVSGKRYCAVVRGYNEAGLYTQITSNCVLIDQDPPQAGSINDGHLSDVDYQSEDTIIAANWNGFTDGSTGSGIMDYRYKVTDITGSIIVSWTSAGKSTNVTHDGLALKNNKYFVTVRAIDMVGLSTDVTSDGVTVDTTHPVFTGEVVVTGVEDIINGIPCVYIPSVSSITVQWAGFSDAHSGLQRYEWAIIPSEKPLSTSDFAVVPGPNLPTSATFQNLSLTQGKGYYVIIRAINGAKLYKDAYSVLVIPDATPPSSGKAFDGPTTQVDIDYQATLVKFRSVNGGWSSWGGWGSCSRTCGTGSQNRYRSCSNPPPKNGGRSCPGTSRQSTSCTIKPCPVNGGWSSWGGWGSCSRTCGTGSQNRYRSCSKPPPRYGGIPCTGTSRQSKSCTIKPCPVNGGWSSWGRWGSCSRTCGSGSQNRYRSCSNPPPRNGGISCPGTSRQSKSCNIKPCPVNGGWSSWGGWGSCSKTCGTGSQNRYRSCSNPPPRNGGISCPGISRQSKSCTIKPCPVNGGWSSWGGWGSCSRTCGTGSQNRYRSCSNPPPSNGGISCIGSSRQSTSCTIKPCPVDGDWSSWSTWTTCSRSCDSGIEVRTRSCSKPLPQYGGKKCPGAAKQQRECNTHSCPVNGGWSAWFVSRPCSLSCGGGTEILSRTCTNPAPKHGGEFCQGDTRKEQVCASNPCPVQGGWSSWSVLTPCSVTCGNGTEILSRTCTNPEPKHGGEFCQGDTQKRQVCTQKPCPVNGGWSSWDIWSPCTKTCEFGTQIRTRNCTQPRPQYGGKTCPGAAVEKLVCNSHLCPVNGGWSAWFVSKPCSLSCGGGTETLSRTCTNPAPNHGGEVCQGDTRKEKVCASNPCPVDGGWSSWDIWSPCTKTCEFGTQIRTRNCTQPRPQYGGKTCPGAAVEERVCNSHLCPVDGGWSEWSGWTDCSVTCGNGTKSRARNCDNPAPIAGGRHCKGLSEDVKSCNASNICYDNIGCYGRFPRSSLLRGFRDEIEWFKPPLKKQMDKVVEKCSRIAMKERLTFFAVEDYGNCYGTQEFFAGSVPKSTRCNFGVGLENFFYVYKVFL